MTDEREIQDIPSDRAAVRLIAERLFPERDYREPPAIEGIDDIWRRELAPRAHDLPTETLDGHIAWFENPPARADAVAFARAHDLLVLVSQFRAETDFLRLQQREPVTVKIGDNA